MEHIYNHFEKLKNYLKKRFVTRIFVVGIIFSLTALFIALDMSKEYKSTVFILVAPKSEVVSAQAEIVVRNIAEFPKTLSFYERLLKFNPEIKDDFSKMSPGEKKEAWNQKIRTSKKGSILKLTVFAKTPAQAEALSQKTAHALFGVVSNFYDIKTDISVSILDGPFVSVASRNWFLAVLLSLLVGFIASWMLDFFLGILEKTFRPGAYSFKKSPLAGLKNRFEKKEVADKSLKEDEFAQDVPYYFEETLKDRIVETEKEAVEAEKKSYDFSGISNVSAKSASAPSNLPIADDSFFLEENKQNEAKPKEEDFMQMKKEEPSEEEMKERLNKLLRGEM